jgi:hypothetical protein
MTVFVLLEYLDETNASAAEAQEALSMLKQKLNNPSPLVKFKTLRCLKYLCQHGRAEIRQDLSNTSSDIKRCESILTMPISFVFQQFGVV